MNNGKLNIEKSKSLDSYFRQAANEKVGFSANDAEKLLESHVAANYAGYGAKTAGKIASGLKSIGMMLMPIVAATSLVTEVLTTDPTERQNPSPAIGYEAIERSIERTVGKNEAKKESPEPAKKKNKASIANTYESFARSSKIVRNIVGTLRDEKQIASEKTNDAKLNQGTAINKQTGPQILASNAAKPLASPAPEISKPSEIRRRQDLPGTDGSAMFEEDDDYGMKTLLDLTFNSAYFGAPTMKMTKINGQPAIYAGGKIGWTINDRFTIGGAGYGLANNANVYYVGSDQNSYSGNIHTGYGGLYLEYIDSPNKLFHYSVSGTFGFGGLLVKNYEVEVPGTTPWCAFYVIEPGASVVLNLTEYMRFGIEASYRYANDFRRSNKYQEDSGLQGLNLSGFSGGFFIKVGLF